MIVAPAFAGKPPGTVAAHIAVDGSATPFTPAGIVSVMVTGFAAVFRDTDGPLLLGVIVQLIAPPAFGVALTAFTTCKSALSMSTRLSSSVLGFVALGPCVPGASYVRPSTFASLLTVSPGAAEVPTVTFARNTILSEPLASNLVVLPPTLNEVPLKMPRAVSVPFGAT